MTDIDVSIVLNMHREALFLAPTMCSLEKCALEARAEGLNVELIAVFDRADDATRLAFSEHDLSVYSRCEIVEVDVGSLGLARNAGAERATGEYIWTSDADDLVSSNAIVALYRTARASASGKVAVFLEYLCAFGEQYHNVRYVGSDLLTAADFAYQHPFVSRVFVHRSTFESLQYEDLRVTSGFAYEDWYFNSELRARGFQLIVAPETILFYRQRVGSLLRQANAASVRLIPHSRLFDIDVFLNDMRECRQRVGDWAAFVAKRRSVFDANNTLMLMSSDKLVGYLRAAIEIEPEIEPQLVETAVSYSPMPWRADHWGMQLEQFYRMIGDDGFTDIVLLPWLNQGGAEKYILQVLEEIGRQQSDAKFLVLAGEASVRHDWLKLLPHNAVFLDVYNAFPALENSDRDAMVIRALLAVAKIHARLHVKSSAFAHRLLDAYAPVLFSNYRIVYYRFSDGTYRWRDQQLRGPWGASVMRRHLSGFWKVLSDCESIVESDRRIMGPSAKYNTVYARCNVMGAERSGRTPRKRLLWASRLASEKRPELLARIAAQLRQNGVEVSIDVYGAADPSVDPNVVFAEVHDCITYRGGFSQVSQIPMETYDAFIYTSAFDGLPNILVEVLGFGLPAIAPDIGGIGEVVVDGVTGFLVDARTDDDLVAAYIGAITSLYENWDATLAMGVRSSELIKRQHGARVHSRRVAQVLELGPAPGSNGAI